MDKIRDPHFQDMVMKILRQILPALGGILATYGWVTDGKWQVIAGVILNVVNMIWMIVNNTKTAMTDKVANLPEVRAVVTEPTTGSVLANETKGDNVVPANSNEAKRMVA